MVDIPRVYNGNPFDETAWDAMATAVEDHDTKIDRLADPTRAKVRSSASQTLTTGVWTALTFNVEDFDVGSGHSTSVNTSRWTAPSAGMVLVSGVYSPASSGTGRRGARWAKNGTVVASSQSMYAAGTTSLLNIGAVTHMIPVAAGDYIEIQALHEHGSNLGTQGSPDEAQSGMNVLLVTL